jgi:hypothetical protein
MNSRQSILLTAIAAFTLFLTACGGGGSSSNTPPAVTVSLSGQPSSLTTNATASITATVSNGTGVTWSVTCATSPCGTFSATSTASGAATVYTAPAAPTTVTITATPSSGTAASAQITISAPAISVAFNPAPPTSLTTGTTSSLTAVVTNDTKNAGVTWSVTCGTTGACGSFSATSTASGTATTYTAPAAIPAGNTVTVTATSVTDTTKTATATITITTPALSVIFNPTPPTSLIKGATTSLTAVVANDSRNGGVTWTVTCGSTGACGSFSSTSTASGTATIYTAPAAIPTNNTVIVTATSVSDTTKFQSATITITNVLADGTYVYHFAGNDSTGPAFFAGAFTVVGGVITGGEQDFSNAAINDSADQLVTSGCSLSVTGSTIQIVLQVTNTSVGVSGVETLRGLASTSSRTLISEFDTFGVATGSIDLQTSAAAPSGGYAFAISGWYFTSTASNPFAIGGILNISGTSLVVANSVFDFNLVGNVGQKQLFASGSVTAPDSYGRVTFTLTPTSTSGSPTFTAGVPAFILTGYVQSPGQIQLVEQADPLNGDLGGVALGQGSKTGQFSASSVANTTYVFAASGEDVNNLTTFAGGFSFNSTGGVSGNLAINDFSFASTVPLSAGSYTVDPTGRVTISNVAAGAPANTTFSFQLYLDGNGNGLELGADNQQVTAGPAYLQTAAPAADFEGTYALAGQGILNTSPNLDFWGAAGPVVITSDSLAGSTDYNAGGFSPTAAVALTGTETSSSTTLSIIGLDATSTSPRTYTYFPIDSRRFVAIETDGAQLGLLTFEGVTH